MRIGLLGGSFDPLHHGHLVLAEAARDGAGLSRVVFMVAGTPPHKRERVLAPAPDRVELVRRAVADHSAFVADDRETRREGPSWTIETVRELLSEATDGDEVLWIVGADSLPDLPDWRDGPELVDLVDFVVAARPGWDVDAALSDLEARIGKERTEKLARGIVPMPRIGISSTEVRRRIREGRSIRYLVPEPVRAYVAERCLYRD